MGRVLLVVDDEENITAALVRLLRRDGYTILKARSGAEGLELLTRHEVGVIIADQRMPFMTGSEFLTRAKDLYPDTIRIVLSGYTELGSVTDAINRGAIYKFLTKPWEDDLLRENVSEAFRHHEMKMENVRLAHELKLANDELLRMNHDLEMRVQEKTREIMLNLNVLMVSQEMLEQLPVAVVGVGEDGMIAVANQMAHQLFARPGQTLFGELASDLIPAEMLLATSHAHGQEAWQSVQMAGSLPVSYSCNQMGELSQSRGKMLVVDANVSQKQRYVLQVSESRG